MSYILYNSENIKMNKKFHEYKLYKVTKTEDAFLKVLFLIEHDEHDEQDEFMKKKQNSRKV